MKEKGFTLFIALVVVGTLTVVATGIVNLAVRQAFVSSSGQESQHAFYAADSGAECAIYWDINNPSGISAFATTTTSDISCNGEDISNVGGSEQSVFTITFTPEDFCAIVEVNKEDDGSTVIESFGYNTCDTTNPRRVERAVRVRY